MHMANQNKTAVRPGSPLDIAQRRETLIIDGLNKLARKFGFELMHIPNQSHRIDSQGNISFYIEQPRLIGGTEEDVKRFPPGLVHLMNSSGAPGFKYVHDMSNGVKANHFDWERLLIHAGINKHELLALEDERQGKTAMEFPTEKALQKYLKDHPDADKSRHKVKKSEPTESAKAIKDFQDAGSRSKAEHVEGVGHHLAPGGVVPLKEHDPRAIATKHTQAQIQHSLEAVKSRLKNLHGEAAEDFTKTKKTLEKALWYSVGDSIEADRSKKANGGPVVAFERSLSAQRVTNRFAMEFPTEEALRSYLKEHPDADRSNHTVKKDEGGTSEKGPDPKAITPKEVSSQIEAGWKGLSLAIPTYTGLRGLNKAINKGEATKKDRDEVLEDLNFEHKRVRGKKDSASKGAAKRIQTLMTLLKSDGVTKMLK